MPTFTASLFSPSACLPLSLVRTVRTDPGGGAARVASLWRRQQHLAVDTCPEVTRVARAGDGRRRRRKSASSRVRVCCLAGGGGDGGGGGERGAERGGGAGGKKEGDGGLVELPLFPLPLVLFPGAMLPLQIFEYRYRMLMHTLLHTDLRFGVVYSGKESGGAAAVGCVGEVIKHEKLPDDRFFLVCRGQERFRVVDIVRSRPYLVAKVVWLEDRPSELGLGLGFGLGLGEGEKEGGGELQEGGGGGKSELEKLADEVEMLMKDVIRLSNKMGGKSEQEVPTDLRKSAFPTPFSFWVASTFEGAPSEQQALLELQDTAERLRRERDTLRNTLNYLTAATAVKDAFSSPSE